MLDVVMRKPRNPAGMVECTGARQRGCSLRGMMSSSCCLKLPPKAQQYPASSTEPYNYKEVLHFLELLSTETHHSDKADHILVYHEPLSAFAAV